MPAAEALQRVSPPPKTLHLDAMRRQPPRRASGGNAPRAQPTAAPETNAGGAQPPRNAPRAPTHGQHRTRTHAQKILRVGGRMMTSGASAPPAPVPRKGARLGHWRRTSTPTRASDTRARRKSYAARRNVADDPKGGREDAPQRTEEEALQRRNQHLRERKGGAASEGRNEGGDGDGQGRRSNAARTAHRSSTPTARSAAQAAPHGTPRPRQRTNKKPSSICRGAPGRWPRGKTMLRARVSLLGITLRARGVAVRSGQPSPRAGLAGGVAAPHGGARTPRKHLFCAAHRPGVKPGSEGAAARRPAPPPGGIPAGRQGGTRSDARGSAAFWPQGAKQAAPGGRRSRANGARIGAQPEARRAQRLTPARRTPRDAALAAHQQRATLALSGCLVLSRASLASALHRSRITLCFCCKPLRQLALPALPHSCARACEHSAAAEGGRHAAHKATRSRSEAQPERRERPQPRRRGDARAAIFALATAARTPPRRHKGQGRAAETASAAQAQRSRCKPRRDAAAARDANGVKAAEAAQASEAQPSRRARGGQKAAGASQRSQTRTPHLPARLALPFSRP